MMTVIQHTQRAPVLLSPSARLILLMRSPRHPPLPAPAHVFLR
jgi:hypothetical protein